MQPEAGTERAKPNPFRFVAETEAGRFDVIVAKGRCAKIRCMPRPGGGLAPVRLGGSSVLVVAEMTRTKAGWSVRALVAGAVAGSAGLGDAETRRLLVEVLAPTLESEMRRFVERDIVDIYARRRAQEDAIASVQAEIERRKEKIRLMRREAARAERELGPAEEALRAELAALDGLDLERAEEAEAEPAPLAMAM